MHPQTLDMGFPAKSSSKPNSYAALTIPTGLVRVYPGTIAGKFRSRLALCQTIAQVGSRFPCPVQEVRMPGERNEDPVDIILVVVEMR